MHVAVIGQGRLGRSLVALWSAAGHTVHALPGRGAAPVDADAVAVLTVPDGSVAEVAQRLPLGPVVLHCAGALDLDVLAPHEERGSLHPLMTFPGPEVQLPDLRGVPAAIAGTTLARSLASRLATDLGLDPFEVPGDRRLYHAAAVLAGNFPFVLLTEAARIAEAAGVSPESARRVFVPLALRSLENSPLGLRALTGPLARADTATLAAHQRALAEHGLSEIERLYATLAKHTLDRLAARDRSDDHER